MNRRILSTCGRALVGLLCLGAADLLTAGEVEPLGPCSHRTGLVISEIHFSPAARGNRNLEFIELFNANPWPEDLSSYRLSGDIAFAFPSGTILSNRSFLVVAKSPADLQTVAGISGVLGPYSDNLPNSSGTVRLRNPSDAVLLEIRYDSIPPWPATSSGAGHSLVLARPSYGEANPAAWAASVNVGGSPQGFEPTLSDPLRAVVINEILARSRESDLDFIELYNHSTQEVDIAGCVITDSPAVQRFVFPSGTSLPARSFLALDEFVLGFGFNADGETIYLRNPSGTRFLDAVRYGSQASGVSLGRFPDGGPEFGEMAHPTPLAPNSGPLLYDVVINEIMYAPLSANVDDEFVELFNRGTNTLDLGGWQIRDGITFTIPTNTFLEPNGYLVIAKNAAHLMSNYAQLTAANTVGNYSGSLSDNRAGIALYGLLPIISTDSQNQPTTNFVYGRIDQVTYSIGGRWSRWAKGGGSSLELIDPYSDHRLAANWADSDESGKSAWTNVEFTGAIDNVDARQGANDSVQLLLLGSGEALVDDVELRNPSGPNLVQNSGFESGLSNWFPQGSHGFSSIAPVGFTGGKSLRLRAAGPGDPGPNRVRSDSLTATVVSPATLRVQARWLRGSPELLLRLHGNGLEAAATLPVPPNLGTPGARNSRAVTNAGPAIAAVTHRPALPAANQPVVVTARVRDPDGLALLRVWVELDGLSSPPFPLPMLDDGTGGDTAAGDGVFSATIPGQLSGVLVAFHIEATDSRGAVSRFPASPAPDNFPIDSPASCLVRFGEPQPPGTLGVYHLWLRTNTVSRWTNRDKLNNAGLDATFVYDTNRVIYNVSARYSGSPWNTTNWAGPLAANRCDYAVVFPADEPFLGSTEATWATPGRSSGANSSDRSALREYLAHVVLNQFGLPSCQRRYVHVFVNGSQRSVTADRAGNFVMEDVQSPGSDFVSQWYSDDLGGELRAVEDWFEFNPAATAFSANEARLARFTTTFNGETTRKLARYRWSWRQHALAPSAAAAGDTNFWDLVDAISPASNPTSTVISNVPALEAVADVDQWMRLFAVQHALGNWFSYGYNHGRGVHAYRGLTRRYELLAGDIDYALGTGDGPTQPLFLASDPRLVALWNTPVLRRAYLSALDELVQGPFNNALLDPILDARAAALMTNGINVDAAALAAIKSYIANRRVFIINQIPRVSFALTGPGTITTSNNLVVLSGTAPPSVRTIRVNGRLYPVTWTTAMNWTIRAILPPYTGLRQVTVASYDRQGLPGPETAVNVAYVGPNVFPQDAIAINEIMFEPEVPGAEFIELRNASANASFDLSGWRLNGVEFTFPEGTLITNGQYWVMAKNREAFAAVYGADLPVAGEFPGALDSTGEVLTLMGRDNFFLTSESLMVDRVRYEGVAPWPAARRGVSLQLIDARQDKSRPANWSADPIARATPGAANSVGSTLTPPLPPLWLNEVQPNNVNGLKDNSGDSDPWLELHNFGTNDVRLAGFYLTDNYASLTQWAFPTNAVIGPKQFIIIWCDGEPAESVGQNWHASFRLNGASGSVALVRRALGQTLVLDYLNYSGLGTNAYGSYPDAQPAYRFSLQSPTPGYSNAPVQLFINEWMAANSRTVADPADGRFDDWFELYNPNSGPVDLSGHYLADSGTIWRVPDGVTVPGRGFLLVWADDSPGQNSPTRADLHTPFRLSAGNDDIRLFRFLQLGEAFETNKLIDQVTFRSQTSDITEGRYPDGSATIAALRTPTPLAANSFPRSNSPPVLSVLSNRTVGSGQTLRFIVPATDVEAPPQALTYSLMAPAPAGATLAAADGLFTWTPTAEQTSSAYPVTVQVTDDGNPPLSALATFTITVVVPPRVASFALLPSGELSLTWQTVSGKFYRVEFKDDLNAALWTPLNTEMLASGETLHLTVSPGPSAQRFFRIVQIE